MHEKDVSHRGCNFGGLKTEKIRAVAVLTHICVVVDRTLPAGLQNIDNVKDISLILLEVYLCH